MNLGFFFSNMYLIDIFVIKKYYFESKLLKSPIFEKYLTRSVSKNEVKGLVGYSFKIVFCSENKENTFGSFSFLV